MASLFLRADLSMKSVLPNLVSTCFINFFWTTSFSACALLRNSAPFLLREDQTCNREETLLCAYTLSIVDNFHDLQCDTFNFRNLAHFATTIRKEMC